MRSIRTALLFVVLANAACNSAADEAAEPPLPEVPMPAEQDLGLPLANAYAVAVAAFVNGDVRMFTLTYSDSAILVVPGYTRMEGRNAIAREFGREGQRLGVRDILRSSDGRYIEGRDVVDSGTYVITSNDPLPAGGLPASGRYWTRWRHAADGTWTIVFDSLSAAGN